jgi:hypothetical protein
MVKVHWSKMYFNCVIMFIYFSASFENLSFEISLHIHCVSMFNESVLNEL